MNVHDKVGEIDLSPRSPQGSVNSTSNPNSSLRATTYVATGAGTPAGNPSLSRGSSQGDDSSDGYVFSFENVPISTLAKVALGDLLNVSYAIDPRVQGTVSVTSGRPVPRKDILYVLENALRMSNAVLVRDGGSYRIIPAADAAGTGSVDTNGEHEAGYGLSVVTLQNVSTQSLLRIMDSFAAKPGMIRADTARNMLVIQGTASERQAALKAALEFDAEWMRGQSVGIFPVSSAAPETMIAELEKILQSNDGGVAQDMVKFVPVARMNAILVVSRKPSFLNMAGTWIKRLDRSDVASAGVKVYRVRYGEARVLAAILNDVFVGQSGVLDASSSQIAPGSSLERLRSDFGSSSSGLGSRATTSTSPGAVGAGPGTTGPMPNDPRSNPASAPGGQSPYNLGAGAGATPGAGRAGVLQGVRITADVVNNAILIYANQENYKLIERTLHELDRPQLQVAIEATIAEVTLNNALSFGVQYFLKAGGDRGSAGLFGPQSKPTTTTSTESSTGQSLTSTVTQLALQRALPGLNLLVGKEADPRAILDTLRTITEVKVLSSPSLVVIDNQPALLQVGDQVPVATTSATILSSSTTPIVNNIDYRNTGIILRVVPRINVNGKITLDVEQESSNVVQGLASANTLTPTVSQRRVKSSVSVASGQTVVLAGLISDRSDDERSGIPGAMAFPVLGNLLSHSHTVRQRTELIVFIKPQIIRDSVDAYMVATELRAKLMGSARPYAGPPVQSGLTMPR